MDKLIILRNDKLLISTNIIAKNCNVEHRSILRLINTHRQDIEDFGKLIEDKEKIPKGRPLNVFLLNEEQFTFLITLMQNSRTTVKAKKKITQEFFRMRKALLQVELNQQNEEWIESREDGKLSRNKIVKEYKNYLEYAIKNGSKTYENNPNLVYSKFTNMVNKSLFDFEFKPKSGETRNFMNKDQLDIISSAEISLQKIIQNEINKGTEYHNIYKISKSKMEQYADIIGKTKIIDLIVSKQITINDLLENKND